jgi:IS5 family transposase
MRQKRTVQAPIFEIFAGHEIGCELKAISQWLDRQRALVSLVAGDLRRHGLRETDAAACRPRRCCAVCAPQATAAVELRRAGLHLEASASFRAFARLPLAWSPKKSVLHQTISAIRPATWEAVNRVVLTSAKQDKRKAALRCESTARSPRH